MIQIADFVYFQSSFDMLYNIINTNFSNSLLSIFRLKGDVVTELISI